ncbi:MAG: hypothetical protein CSA81_14225 [Acidobacteria bacterium]|nr:MAG: hypothetical protein CSA81_14225 [Acidobacteriota bacterium]
MFNSSFTLFVTSYDIHILKQAPSTGKRKKQPEHNDALSIIWYSEQKFPLSEIMTENNTTNRRTTRRTRSKVGCLFLVLLLPVVAVSLFFFSPPDKQEKSLLAIKEGVEKTVAAVKTSLQEVSNTPPAAKPEKETPEKQEGESVITSPAEMPQQDPAAPVDQQEEEKSAESIINDFFAHLDNAEYIKKFSLHGSSSKHLSDLAQKLLDNPPVVVSETDDLFTLLKNTAHFFRVAGKDNVLLLKGILHNEREQMEDILRALYRLSENKEKLEKSLAITCDDKALYDYATFFLDTVGGRLYLFRRDSSSRMVVTYYAIRILDQANDRHDSPHGTDIRPAINSLIDEMENGGNSLKFRKQYLDKLYQLQEKYQQ